MIPVLILASERERRVDADAGDTPFTREKHSLHGAAFGSGASFVVGAVCAAAAGAVAVRARRACASAGRVGLCGRLRRERGALVALL